MKSLFFIFFYLLLPVTSLYSMNYDSAKPWIYWWWMGNSVSEAGITYNLQQLSEKGFGGVHIIPIYGEKGDENNFVSFLSPRWRELYVYTMKEAKRLNLGVDMSSGTGWPLGGNIPMNYRAKKMLIERVNVDTLASYNCFDNVVGYSFYDVDNSLIKYFTGEVIAKDSILKYTPQYVCLLKIVNTNQKVKRAAPGGEGYVLDYFDKDAVLNYMDRFVDFFCKVPCAYKPRALYHDSYEVYSANATFDIVEEFEKRRGYSLLSYLNVLMGDVKDDSYYRLLYDYNLTISDLLLEEFAMPWVKSAHDLGILTRNQAHGSPANILDLYAIADIPETEIFGPSKMKIPGLYNRADTITSMVGNSSGMMKFASSAAHIKGHKLIASETGTWLSDHFQVSLSQLKNAIDELFIGGINHIFYHGMTYNPPQVDFPGRLFYASSNVGIQSYFWPYIGKLNKYVQECQKRFQSMNADNDILLYFPIHEIWSRVDSKDYVRMFDRKYLTNLMRSNYLYSELSNSGFSFDYISDKMLKEDILIKDSILFAGNMQYKVIVIPEIDNIPLETMETLYNMAIRGVEILFEKHMPIDVPGLNNLLYRREKLEEISSKMKQLSNVRIVNDIVSALKKTEGVLHEEIPFADLKFIRYENSDKYIYFICNQSDQTYKGWLRLAVKGRSVSITDLDNYNETNAVRESDSIYLELSSGQSTLVTVHKYKCVNFPVHNYYTYDKSIIDLSSNWTFSYGNNSIIHLDTLVSWPTIHRDLLYYSGMAKYEKEFVVSDEVLDSDMFLLKFDMVHEIADIFINDYKVETLWKCPYEISIPRKYLSNVNRIKFYVRNNDYNRMIQKYKEGFRFSYYDVGFVNIRYKNFDISSEEPFPSGIIGKVFIIPMKIKLIEETSLNRKL